MKNELDRQFQALFAAEDPGSRPGVFRAQTEGLRVHRASGDGYGGRSEVVTERGTRQQSVTASIRRA